LDAELLADVYINLTRGQNALLMDDDDPNQTGPGTVKMDYSSFTLPVIQPTALELQAHEQLLTQIDKASGGKTLWRSLTTE
jgi:DNA polymerase-3 subunit epsilon